MLKIDMFETTPGFFTVIVNEKYATNLTRDEALGVVASALFGNTPIFVRSYEEDMKWKMKYGVISSKPIAELERGNHA